MTAAAFPISSTHHQEVPVMGKTYRSENAKKMAEQRGSKPPPRPSKKQTNKSHHDGKGQSGQQSRR